MSDTPTPQAMPLFVPGAEALADDLNLMSAGIDANTADVEALSQRRQVSGFSASSLSLPAGSWNHMPQTGITSDPAGAFTPHENGMDMRVNVPGIYAVSCMVSGSAGEAGWRFIVAPTVNGAGYPDSTYWWHDATVYGDYVMCGARPLGFNAGDSYQLWLYNRSGQMVSSCRTWLTSLGHL